MSGHVELHLLCLCAALIFTGSLAGRRRADPASHLLLAGCIALLASAALRLLCWEYAGGVSAGAVPALRLLSDVLATGAAGAAAGFFVLCRRRCVPAWAAAGVPFAAALVYALAAGDSGWLPAGALPAVLSAWAFDSSAREAELRRRYDELEHRQAVLLQEQMRPHFLFNVLSSLRELCKTDPALAGAGMEDFSAYLRQNLDALAGRDLIPFSQELDYIRHYVALEKLRPSGDFEVWYDLAVLDFSVPALSIQPLVENAIRHGVRDRAGGRVILTTERWGDTVRVIVEDNGPGFPPGMSRIQKERGSHALENVARRLETQCGGALYPRSGDKGTRIVALFPGGRNP